MNSAHEQQMNYLLIAIAVLAIAILFPIIKTLLSRRSKSTQVNKTELPHASQTIPTQTAPTQPVTESNRVAVAEEVKPITEQALQKDHQQPTPEKETTYEQALEKTRKGFFGRIKNAFSNSDKKKIIEEVEEVLYTSDLGPTTVQKLLDKVETELSSSEMANLDKVKTALAQQMQQILFSVHESQSGHTKVSQLLSHISSSPKVLMVVGVNGAGKTTSIGKITAQLASEGAKVLVAAGDTFRAAAGGQLKVWTDRAQNEKGHVEIFWPDQVTDPAAVAFDAIAKAKAQNYDYIILDTAGRLHTQGHLMEELKKVKRVMTKVIADAPHETWIVLDANSGQNALNQAVEFNKALEVTGVVLTKMDGTAKGGVALGVVDQLAKPIRLVGLGEKIGDLKVFNPQEYITSILG